MAANGSDSVAGCDSAAMDDGGSDDSDETASELRARVLQCGNDDSNLAEGYDLEAMDGSCLDLAITESESVAGYYLYEVYNSSSDCIADH